MDTNKGQDRIDGQALWLASFSKATPESALRSSGLSEEQIRRVKTGGLVARYPNGYCYECKHTAENCECSGKWKATGELVARVETTLTRHDWNGKFDSIKWALETHCGMQDHCDYNFAVLYGNEDCPEQIDFYKSENPNWNTPEDYVWKS